MPAKKTTAKKTTAKKTTAKKTTAKKTMAKKTMAKKTMAKKTTARKTTARKSGAVTTSNPARRGDLIVVDSHQVGSPAREGEVLEVIEGEMRVSYRVRWLDGHESIFTPAGGSLHLA